LSCKKKEVSLNPLGKKILEVSTPPLPPSVAKNEAYPNPRMKNCNVR